MWVRKKPHRACLTFLHSQNEIFCALKCSHCDDLWACDGPWENSHLALLLTDQFDSIFWRDVKFADFTKKNEKKAKRKKKKSLAIPRISFSIQSEHFERIKRAQGRKESLWIKKKVSMCTFFMHDGNRRCRPTTTTTTTTKCDSHVHILWRCKVRHKAKWATNDLIAMSEREREGSA